MTYATCTACGTAVINCDWTGHEDDYNEAEIVILKTYAKKLGPFSKARQGRVWDTCYLCGERTNEFYVFERQS